MKLSPALEFIRPHGLHALRKALQLLHPLACLVQVAGCIFNLCTMRIMQNPFCCDCGMDQVVLNT